MSSFLRIPLGRPRNAFVGLVASAIVAGGCGEAETATPQERTIEAALVAGAHPTIDRINVPAPAPIGSVAAGEPVSEEVEARAKREASAPGHIIEDVDEDAVAAHPTVTAGAWSEETLRAIAAAPVPLLLTADEAVAGTAFVTTGEHWASVQMRGDGVWISAFGTRLAHMHPELQVPPEARLTDDGGEIAAVYEGIPTVSFRRFGIAYRLDVECDAGPGDPRCQGLDYLRAVQAGLAVADGGAR